MAVDVVEEDTEMLLAVLTQVDHAGVLLFPVVARDSLYEARMMAD